MQRFIASVLGIALVIGGFYVFVTAQPEHPVRDAIVEILPGLADAPAISLPDVAPEAPKPAAGSAAGDALTALDSVRLTPATRVPAYDRDQFGPTWADVDGNGCDTRNDILARDLHTITKDGACTVLTGTLNDPYTGKTIDFTRGKATSSAVQIDHIVSASAAWKGGAQSWTPEQRLAFANDPQNLLATDGPTNGGKSDKGPAQWMPTSVGNPGYDCTYATSYAQVLVKYELTAPAGDLLKLRTTLALCA